MTTPAHDPMFFPYDHEAEMEIDRGEVRVAATGRFADESEWYDEKLEIAQLVLVAWKWEGKWHLPERLIRIVGDRRLTLEERRITALWAETAEDNRRDYLADEARNDRRDSDE